MKALCKLALPSILGKGNNHNPFNTSLVNSNSVYLVSQRKYTLRDILCLVQILS
jgi:hypothetical protein